MMNAIGTNSFLSPGPEVRIPPVTGMITSYYYFSQPAVISNGMRVSCGNVSMNSGGPVVLVFAPGVDGFRQETGPLTQTGGFGQSDISGCAIISLGGGDGTSSLSSSTISNIYFDYDTPLNHDFVFPSDCNAGGAWGACFFGAGDGIVAFSQYNTGNAILSVAPGAYVATANAAGQSITLASPYTILDYNSGVELWDLPVKQKFSVNTTMGSGTITVTAGPRLLVPGDVIWNDAFLFGSTVVNISNAIAGTPTVNASGSGFTGASGTLTWSGSGCVTPPVLNVTASGGHIVNVSSVANAGDCLQSTPSSSATTWTAGGGLSGGSGASFNMTFNESVDVGNFGYNGYTVNASKSETGGKLWTIPKGIARRVQGSSHNTNISYFGFGIDLTMQGGSIPATGGNSSFDELNVYSRNLVARMTRGNEGVHTVIGNVYAHNYFADTVEAMTIGSFYAQEEYNSPEDGNAPYSLLVICGTQNYSFFYGGYYGGGGPCLGGDANGNASIGVPAASTQGQAASEVFIGSMYGSPGPAIGPESVFHGAWTFEGPTATTTPANQVASAGATTIYLNTSTNYKIGLGITDLTHSVIPANTTITGIGYGVVTISNAVTGGGVQINDQLQISGGANCMQMTAGLPYGGATGLIFDSTCGFSGGLPGLLYSYGVLALNTGGGSVEAKNLTLEPQPYISVGVCYAGNNEGFYATINNGKTFAAAGYGVYVGDYGTSPGGTTIRAIYCAGALGWVYH
jgi:hypothetical protein